MKTRSNGYCLTPMGDVAVTEDQTGTTWWNRDRVIPRTEQRTVGSRWLYRIDHYSSQPIVAVTVIVLLVSALIIGVALGFPPAGSPHSKPRPRA